MVQGNTGTNISLSASLKHCLSLAVIEVLFFIVSHSTQNRIAAKAAKRNLAYREWDISANILGKDRAKTLDVLKHGFVVLFF